MGGIAFYAPLKPPTDPVPSGDRTMARGLFAALGGIGLGTVRLVSNFRSREGNGDPKRQDEIIRSAESEIDRIAGQDPPSLWVTYHSYYKAPDLVGPALSRLWRIPYVLVEATRARKRLVGPYATFAVAVEASCDTADVIFYLTERDSEALKRDVRPGQRLVRLRPFLNQEELCPVADRQTGDRPLRFLACAMFREGDKLDSYTALATALALVKSSNWRLTIVGDGPKRGDIEALFVKFGAQVELVGALETRCLAKRFADADLLLWPGVGEAYGMVYLEAQALGCPVLAEDRPGVRDVVRDGGWLVAANDASAFAAAIDRLIADSDARISAGLRARARIAADHLLPSARATLKAGLDPLVGRSGH